jgi:hypothetical protein
MSRDLFSQESPMRGASLEPNRVTIVMQAREVLEVYHAHPPVGRFPFRRLVGVYGSGACHDQEGRDAEGIQRLNTTRLSAFPSRDIAVLRGRLHAHPCKLRIIDVAGRRPAQKAPPGRGLSRDETWDRQNPRAPSLQRRVSELGQRRLMSASVPTMKWDRTKLAASSASVGRR